MNKYNIKNKDDIKLSNILFTYTTEVDYSMERILLLEDMPNTDYDEYVLVEGYHCSCYDFDESKWEGTLYTREELNKLLKDEKYGLRYELKKFLDYYFWGRR